jgi:WD40 repeat protein
LRNIVATESQLWAATEIGLRFWNFTDLCASWYGVGGESVVRSGDEESAPFRESVWTSPALCLVADEGNRLVWSGHKDGKIRCWNMDDQNLDDNSKWSNHFKERLSWHAHRGPVLSLTITSYGYFSFFILSCYADACLDWKI